MDMISVVLVAVLACLALSLGVLLFRYAQRSSALGVRVQVLDSDVRTERQAKAEASNRANELERDNSDLRHKLEESRIVENRATVAHETLRQGIEEGKKLQDQTRESFQALAAEALENVRKSFMTTAKATLEERERAVKVILAPLSEQLTALGHKETRLQEKIENLERLTSESSNNARNLFTALTFQPNVSGEWGEKSVERVFEMGGFTKGVDYLAQKPTKAKRPDFRIKLPNGREIFVDSKVNISSFSKHQRATHDDERKKYRRQFREHLRKQIVDLANKDYGGELRNAADFVMAAVPDFAYLMAIEHTPDLFELAAERQVVICSHSMLVAIVQVVKVGRMGLELSDDAEEIKELSKKLYEGIADFTRCYEEMGSGLKSLVTTYNAGSELLTDEIEPAAGELKDHGVPTSKRLTPSKKVYGTVRPHKNPNGSSTHGTGSSPEYAADSANDDDSIAGTTLPSSDDAIADIDHTNVRPIGAPTSESTNGHPANRLPAGDSDASTPTP